MKLIQNEDQIRALQADLCKLKVAVATRTTKSKGGSKVGQPYARERKQKPQQTDDPTGKKYSKKN